MFDLHNHILPGIDDGSPDVETSIALAKVALDDGITHMVCTPHINAGRFDNTIETIEKSYNLFMDELIQREILLNIAYAAEVRIGPELMLNVIKKTLPFLGQWQGSNLLLLEFTSNSIPHGIEKLFKWLRKDNITPVIAHPERNYVLQRNFDRLNDMYQIGCLLQITGSSLEGQFGNLAQEVSENLLKKGMVSLIATDAHNLAYRPPILSKSIKIASDLIGEEMALKLVRDNPMEMTKGKFESNEKLA